MVVPESRYGLDCATIADDALITAAVPSGSSADPLVTASGVGIAIPRVTSIISVGGNVCEWSNGCPPERPVRDQPGVFRNRRRSPIASRCGWSEMAASFGMPYDMRECNPYACSMSAAVGDAWVTLFGAGAFDPVATDALFSAVIAAVEGAGSPAATVTPSRDRPQFGECEEVIPTTTVQAITGLADAGLNNDAGGRSAASEATLVADNLGCHWMSEDQMAIASSVTWVHDGRWATNGQVPPAPSRRCRSPESAPMTSRRCDAIPTSDRRARSTSRWGRTGSTCRGQPRHWPSPSPKPWSPDAADPARFRPDAASRGTGPSPTGIPRLTTSCCGPRTDRPPA